MAEDGGSGGFQDAAGGEHAEVGFSGPQHVGAGKQVFEEEVAVFVVPALEFGEREGGGGGAEAGYLGGVEEAVIYVEVVSFEGWGGMGVGGGRGDGVGHCGGWLFTVVFVSMGWN